MASNVVSDNFETGSGGVPQLGGADRQTQWCKAWVNFNGTGTVAIRDSYNVSSITDNGTGDYTVNFTTAMANADYTVGVVGQGSGTTNLFLPVSIYATTTGGNTLLTPTTSAFRFTTWRSALSGQADTAYVMAQVFGD